MTMAARLLLPLLLAALPQHLQAQSRASTEFQAAVATTNGLGLDLYRRMATSADDDNLFVSPFSIAEALTMLAEGATDETRAEILRMLHVPTGRELAEVHQGFQALQRRYAAGGGHGNEDLRAQVAELRAALDAANTKAVELQRGRDWQGASEAASKAQALADQINELLPRLDRYELSVANAVWVDQTQPLLPTFGEVLQQYHGDGVMRTIDFQNQPGAARTTINQWIAQKTGNRIRDLLPANSIRPATRMVVSNAIWFRGEWQRPFLPTKTKTQDFRLASGIVRRVPMMRDSYRYGSSYAAFHGNGKHFATPAKVPAEPGVERPATYPGADGFTMVELPYKGGDLAMLVIAPRTATGLSKVESLLTPESLTAWTSKLENRTVNLSMPRFELDETCTLEAQLKALGMQRAFVSPGQPGAAQFARITNAANPREQLHVSNVLHRAFVQVNEKGTEAAAATAVMMAAGMAMPSVRMVPFVPVFEADRPFLLIIRDVQTGAILFLGRVADPLAGQGG